MSAQHRSKRRKLDNESSSNVLVTPKKPAVNAAQTPRSEPVPLSRTLGLFKKYHKQSPSSPQSTKSTARNAGQTPVKANASARHDSAVMIVDESVHESESDGEEIVLRSSGRKRTVTEKLREVKKSAVNALEARAVNGKLETRAVDRQLEARAVNGKPELRTVNRRSELKKDTALYDNPGKLREVRTEVNDRQQLVHRLSGSKTIATDKENIAPELDEVPATTEKLSPEDIALVKGQVLAQLTGKTATPLVGMTEQYSRVSTLLEQTIAAGESNSMLLIGPRGSGKSTMLNQIINEQRKKHAEDFHIVRLTGFIHTDDKLALREIWRQLGREMEIDNTTHSYADTMSMLLALLSHPLELGIDAVAKSVIFILDEFDLFATHPRQTLLYNLFDIAQSRKAPIAVLGLTTRVDTVEQLEKRVKSRFSHRYVHMSLPRNFEAYTAICTATLKTGHAPWDSTVDVLFSHLRGHLKKLFYRSKSVPDFMASMLLPISTLTVDAVEHILAHLPTAPSKLNNLSALSTMGTALLVCAARQSIYSVDNASFDVVYEEYKTLAAKMKLQAAAAGALSTSRVWIKEVARLAWLELAELGFLVDDRVDVSLEELAESGADLGLWSKYCKQI